jgi:hypothetical protein
MNRLKNWHGGLWQHSPLVTLTLQLPEGVKLETVKIVQGICDSTQLPLITCLLADLSIATPDSQSVATVNLDLKLEDAGLLVLTQDAKVTAKEYWEKICLTR